MNTTIKVIRFNRPTWEFHWEEFEMVGKQKVYHGEAGWFYRTNKNLYRIFIDNTKNGIHVWIARIIKDGPNKAFAVRCEGMIRAKVIETPFNMITIK